MPTAVKQYQIDITTNPAVIIQTAEPIASNVGHPLPVGNIITVTPVYYNYRPVSGPLSIAVGAYATGPDTITIPGVYTDQILAGDSIVIAGSTATPVSTAITAYTTAPESITFTGVYTANITPGMIFTITGSTNNDGAYTAISASDDGISTTVVVLEVINPAIVDGTVGFTPTNTNDGTFTVVSVSDNGVDTAIVVLEAVDPAVTGGTATFTPHAGSPENNETGRQFAETYPYPTMTVLRFTLHDDLSHEIELQSVTNQPTWNTGTFAALQQAMTDITALL